MRIRGSLVPAVAVLLVVTASPLRALEEMAAEEDVAELLATPPEVEDEGHKGRQWAIIPQVGYGPDTGPVGGAKFTHRNLGGVGLTLDLDGTYALEQQQSFSLGIGSPHLFGDRALIFFRAEYDSDPQMEFFGLGNNDVGPDAASTQYDQQADGFLTIGWRPWRRLALNFSVGLRDVEIGRGERDGDTPFTKDAFPNLPGIDGGMVNPLELSLVYTTRESVVRPRGIRAILKVSHTNHKLLSDFEFTRFIVDLSYWLRFKDRHALGARLNGGFMNGPERDIPFWELEELGGNDTLRGFFPRRFLGSQRVLGNLEYNLRFGSFDFFDIWHVTVEGAAFGGAGRVFITDRELRDEFELDEDFIDRVVDDLQYSYGGGLRFLLSEALVARVDIGFSDEETALVYLSFGHAF
jgi:outer membrane protein assembly factor BamA